MAHSCANESHAVPATKRKSATTDRPAKRDGAVRVVDAGLQVVALNDDDDALNDILGEIVEPEAEVPVESRDTPGEPDPLDDLLGELDEASDAAGTDSAKAAFDLDDLLDEVTGPAKDEAEFDLDDLLDEVAGPEPVARTEAQSDAAFDLDDLLDEVAGPAKSDADFDLDDLLDEVAGPEAAVPVDDFDDILSEIAGPAPQPEPDLGLDDILSEISGPAPAVATDVQTLAAPVPAVAPVSDDFNDMLDEVSAATATPEPEPAPVAADEPEAAPKKPGIGAKIGGLLGGIAGKLPRLSFIPSLKGTREISRKAHACLVGLCCVLGVVTIGQAVFIAVQPAAHAPAHAVHVPKGATLVPTDYAKVDLELYADKVRSLSEGGRDMLRNPKIKEAVVGLDNGEQLYDSLRALARRSPMADRVDVRDNRITIASCDGVTCSDKDFKLSYDVVHETATVCVTERYVDGTAMSYSYSEAGYKEQPGC